MYCTYCLSSFLCENVLLKQRKSVLYLYVNSSFFLRQISFDIYSRAKMQHNNYMCCDMSLNHYLMIIAQNLWYTNSVIELKGNFNYEEYRRMIYTINGMLIHSLHIIYLLHVLSFILSFIHSFQTTLTFTL